MIQKKCDILVFTALVEEHRAVVEIFLNFDTKESIDDKIYLTVGTMSIGIICLNGMGNVNSAVQSVLSITRHEPKYTILCGIAGGIKTSGGMELGDIIVAEQVILYESSKLIPAFLGYGTKVERRTQTYRSSRALIDLAKHLQVDRWPDQISIKLQSTTTERLSPRVVFGPIASGEKVVANDSFLKPIKKSYPTLKGIEMEGGGISLAADSFHEPCESLVVKSICDWADNSKNDEWHTFSSYAAAVFTKHLVDKISTNSTRNNINENHAFKDSSSSTTNGIFIEFLNPESQRIYGLKSSNETDAGLAKDAIICINAAILLCDKGVVFPIGTFLETPYLMSILPTLKPLIDSGKIKFSIREKSITEFIEKRQRQYSDQKEQYPNLFLNWDNNGGAIPDYAFIKKDNLIGLRIAEEFKIGPKNLIDWEALSNIYNENELNIISQIPMALIEDDKSVTWTSLKTKLEEKSITPHQELRRLLQISYCKIYASEYGLAFLQNVDMAPFQILPKVQSRRYDYHVLKRVLSISEIWDLISSLSGKELLSLCESNLYADFMDRYCSVFEKPATNEKIDSTILNISKEFMQLSNEVSLSVSPRDTINGLAISLYKLSSYAGQLR
jgi:nucleoside phosphorylase